MEGTETLYKSYALSGALAVSIAFLFVSGFSAMASKDLDKKWISLWNTSLILALVSSSFILAATDLNIFFGIGLIVSGYATSPWRVRLKARSSYLYIFSALYSISLLLSFYFQLPFICLITIVILAIQMKIEAYKISRCSRDINEIISRFKNIESRKFFFQDFVNNFSSNFNQLILGILPEKIFFSISMLIKLQLILNNILYSFIRQHLFGNQKVSAVIIGVRRILAISVLNFIAYYAGSLVFDISIINIVMGVLFSLLIFIAHYYKDRSFWPNPKPLSELIGYFSGTVILFCIYYFKESQLTYIFFGLWLSAQLVRHLVAQFHAKYFG